MHGGQLTDNADLTLREALIVLLQCIGQGVPAASLCEFATSHLPTGPTIYPFTSPEAYRYSHHSPRTMWFLFPGFATYTLCVTYVYCFFLFFILCFFFCFFELDMPNSYLFIVVVTVTLYNSRFCDNIKLI